MCAYQVSVAVPSLKCENLLNIFFEIKQIVIAWFALQELLNSLVFLVIPY